MYAVKKDGSGFRAVNGPEDCTDEEFFSEMQPLPSSVMLKANQLGINNSKFQTAMLEVVAGYPEKEISSWAKQEDEARAYQQNNSAATPLVDALAAARGIEKGILVSRIIAKADLFAQVSGTLIGKRQKLEDQLNALPNDATAEEIEAIAW